MVDAGQPWDRRPNESIQAYSAFVAYRDLRASRSIDAAYVAVTGQQQSNKRATGRFTSWSQEFEWKKRAEAYDGYIERNLRIEYEETAISAYRRDLAAYQERQKKLSAAATNAAIGLLSKASEGLKAINPLTLKPMELASLFRAAASVAEAASNSEASALAVEELIKTV